MKLTKKLEKEILKVYNTYCDAIVSGDTASMAACVDNSFQIIGSAEGEVFLNKKEAMKFYTATADQIAGKVEIRNRKIKTKPVNDLILINEISDLYALIEDKWVFYSKFRLTSLLKKIGKAWKFVQVHASVPDSKTEEGEQLALEKIQKENVELREAVKRRTVELEQQNRELEIEAALEKVRAIAMGIRKPDDMLDVCKTISLQLYSLGVKEIRNVQTAIFYPQRGTYMNFEYYAKHQKTIITETSYTNHKLHKAFARKMLKGKGEFFVTHIKGKKVKDWIAYQKTTNVFIDKFLETASSVNYYWFSLGPVALGFSTYQPLTEVEINLFKRFLKVFELAYRRYLDIEKAEVHARESEIQLALEKVRSVALAMKEPSDMIKLCRIIVSQLKILGVKEIRNVQTIILNEKKSTYLVYQYFAAYRKGIIEDSEYNKHPTALELAKSIKKSANAFFSQSFSGTSLNRFRKYRKLDNQFLDPKLDKSSSVHFYFYSIGPGALGLSTYNNALNDNELYLLKQFRNVLELAYKRFTDIEQAVTQAREAQIELALERVRARTMAMHHSEELKEVISVTFDQIKGLSITLDSCVITLFIEGSTDVINWVASTEQKYPQQVRVPNFKHPLFNKVRQSRKRPGNYFTIKLSKKENQAFYNHILENSLFGKIINEKRRKMVMNADSSIMTFANFRYTGIRIGNFRNYFYSEEESNTVLRFANVFEQTYTRFLDLQKAEAQAREAEIELALERVRARTMAMHRSEELSETAYVLFEQFRELGENPEQLSIGIVNESERVLEIWVTVRGNKIDHMFKVPLDEPTVISKTYSAWKGSKKSLVIDISGDQLKKYNSFRNRIPDFKEYNEIKNKNVKQEHRRVMHCAFFTKGLLSLATPKPRPEETIRILERFASVFDLTYTRFLDLQKAEAQAREAQIEASLERVRAVAMSMNKSEDLLRVGKVLFKELQNLDFKDLRNSLINIFNDEKRSFINYDYSDYLGGSISNVLYSSHPANEEFVNQIRKNIDAFVETVIDKNQLNEWKEFRRSHGEEDDPRLDNINALYYYNYSIESGSIGISTFQPISEKQLKILKRFRNVFNLSYQRYMDIAQAEAQARESQIQLALERVRARSIAMHKSEELLDVITIVSQQLLNLGFNFNNVSFGINSDSYDFDFWVAAPNLDNPFKIHLPYLDSPVFNRLKKAQLNGKSFFVDSFSPTETKEWMSHLLTHNNIPEFDLKIRKFLLSRTGFVRSAALLKNIFLFLINYDGIPYSDEENNIIKRFAEAFDQAYIRFLDLKKAEAQAREAEIELALERVRASTMAMHSSRDVGDAVVTLYDEVINLKTEATTCGIAIIHDTGQLETWTVTSRTAIKVPEEKRQLHMGFLDVSMHPFLMAIVEAFQNNQSNFSYDLEGESMIAFFKGINDATNYSGNFDIATLPSKIFNKFFFFREGALFVESLEELSQVSSQIFTRFAIVFGQTYRRYLDLKKAEAQAREAQIEAALERVRSRTMGMQKSDELKEVIKIVYQQLTHLKIKLDHAGFVIDYTPKGDWHFWIADERDIPSKITHPYFESIWANQFNEAKEKGTDLFETNLNFEEKNKFYNELLSYVPGLPETSKEFYLSCPGLAATTVLFDDVSLYIENFSGTPYTDEENKILLRFGKVFQQTYTRFLDLQKAEAQAREARIEASLERVRSKAMAMHSSTDLAETIGTFYTELKSLGVIPRRCGVALIDKETRMAEVSTINTTEAGDSVGVIGKIKMAGHPILENIFDNWLQQKEYHTILRGNQINEYYKVLKPQITYPDYPHDVIQFGYYFMFKEGDVYAWTDKKLVEEELKIFRRFTTVISLTYKRYIDLQNAEAQARESQIEAALERVRAKAMAMHSSNDLSDTMGVLFSELPKLGISSLRCGVVLLSKKTRQGVFYAAATTQESDSFTMIGAGDMTNHPVFRNQYERWMQNENYFITLSGEELQSYYKEIFARLSKEYNPKEHKLKTEHGYYFSFSEGMFYAWSEEPYSEESISILNRFKAIINLTFRRYIDIKKAEAQAREAEIEAALERVRSRTMAMQKSNELAETASHLFDQLNGLGIKPYRFNIAIVDPETERCQLWSTTNEGKVIPTGPLIPLNEHSVFIQMYNGWKQQESFTVIRVQGEERIAWTEYIMKYVSFNEYKPENVDLEILKHEPAIFSNFSFKQGFIVVHTVEEINEKDLKIIQRFVNVFEQTYTRFQDLQKAEEQAREAKIEASLERVRSKAMAMHSPNDLSESVNVFFKELKTLGIVPIRCGVGQIDEATRTTSLTTTTSSQQGDSFQVIGKVKQTGHPVLDGIFDHWKVQKEYYPVLEGEDIKAYYNVMNPQIGYPDYPEGVTQYGNNFPFKEGFVFAWTENKLSEEELQIFRRFTSVLSLTYRRYIDLKAAEVRAFEAVRQASLDRIRAEIASMRTSEDLNHITPIIWRELKNLEVPFFRCGVYIIDEKTEMVQVYLTTPDGKSLGVLNLSFDSNEITKNTVEHWQKKQVYKTHWDKEEFISWTKSMMNLGQIQSAETYQGSTTPPESLYLHFIPFAQGMLYVGDVNPLTDEKLQLIKTLAEAFSIAYARYEDFKNLEYAKNKIEITLSELKSAQAQLVHSEKMASLGELTAGIAHEIKNPLNFVNNFSEVSRELLDEMKTEIDNKNIGEVIELIEDLKQNLDKINQHGKRADSIVKGMLLHSRGTSGEKTLTDINDLLDQYVNLAYHGMRAQNKEFNISIEKDYDESIEKINVVPQDISRVFLNIINNACYAAFDKKKKGDNNFSPTLKVSTKKLSGKVEVRISDNGNGIPSEHLDKIFQPFFTTKPTGEGTGLGLSLSYDIVTKVHGGDLKVETKVNEGSQFIIQLPLY